MPQVSIVTATRNRPNVLACALRSIASQTFQDYEVLIVDDGSPRPVLEQYEELTAPFDGRARVLVKDPLRDKSGTPAIARNRGIREASGAWIAFLDDDDRWLDPKHLETAVRSLQQAPSELFFANMRGERDGVIELAEWYPGSPLVAEGVRLSDDPPVLRVGLSTLVKTMRHHCVHPNVTVVSREVLTKIGGFCERVVFSEDYDLAMRLIDATGSAIYSPAIVAAYALPIQGSHSLRVSPLEQLLDRLCSTANIRATCRQATVRRCARQRQSWTLRELANEIKLVSRAEARGLCWEAVAVYPSAGSVLNLLRSIASG